MTNSDLHCRNVAMLWSTAPTPESFAPVLQHAIESRMRAMRIVKSAACARSDLAFEVSGSALQSGALSTLRGFDYGTATPEQREGQLYALLEAALKTLAITNEALTDLALSVARHLVGAPGRLVSGSELAVMLGVSEEAVRQRHQAGKLIAILSSGRERGRGFPVFQAWQGIAGEPLEQILRTLGYEGPGKATDAADVFQFFISRNALLGDFTPVEVLTGAGVPDADDVEGAKFLSKPHPERLEFVIGVAGALVDAHRP